MGIIPLQRIMPLASQKDTGPVFARVPQHAGAYVRTNEGRERDV